MIVIMFAEVLINMTNVVFVVDLVYLRLIAIVMEVLSIVTMFAVEMPKETNAVSVTAQVLVTINVTAKVIS